jgi:hypothetical protein
LLYTSWSSLEANPRNFFPSAYFISVLHPGAKDTSDATANVPDTQQFQTHPTQRVLRPIILQKGPHLVGLRHLNILLALNI